MRPISSVIECRSIANLIRNLVRYLNPTPAVLVDAPHSVETVITRDRPDKPAAGSSGQLCGSPTATSAPLR